MAEDPLRAVLAEIGDARGDVGLHRRRGRLLHVRPVFELLVALRRAGGPAEVVESNGGDAALGEAQGELLVEAVEAADVGEDDDGGSAGLFRHRLEGREAVVVRRVELEPPVGHGGAPDDGDGRQRVEVEAHQATAASSRRGRKSSAPARSSSISCGSSTRDSSSASRRGCTRVSASGEAKSVQQSSAGRIEIL